MKPNAEPYPKTLSRLSVALTDLPGINRRSAEKIALSAAMAPELDQLANAVREWRAVARRCEICNGLTDQQTCTDCQREPQPSAICVVETQADAWAVDRAQGVWTGGYHILDGVIDPMDGITPEDIGTARLMSRVEMMTSNPMSEVLLAMSNTTQGNLTAQYLAEHVSEMGVTATVLSRGIANGAQVKAQAPATLKAAFANRRAAGR